MKKFILILGMIVYSVTLWAQNNQYIDIVNLKNGSIIKGIIIEQVINESIKIQTADGCIFVYNYDDILKLDKEFIPSELTSPQNNEDDNNTENMCEKAYDDASLYYNGKGALTGVIWATAMILPIGPVFALIPAGIASSTDVPYENLNCPNRKMYQENQDYRNCYQQTAKKIKRKKVWKHFGISTGVYIGIMALAAAVAS